MEKCIFFYEGCNRKPKTEFGLKNTGKHWQLEFVCPPIYESCGFWLVLQKYFSTSSFFGVVDMNSITDAAIINRFLKLLFCNKSWFLDITQSKYIITRQQCLKSPEMLILCEAGQNYLQKCPSLTKFLPMSYLAHSVPFRPPNTTSPDQHGLWEVVDNFLVGHHLGKWVVESSWNIAFTSVQNWSVSWWSSLWRYT